MKDFKKVLNRGVAEIIDKESLTKRLKSSKKLVVKLGIDPTGAQLHLGHAVVLRKLRQFQDLGHEAVLVIGDFTAKIGDPSGRTQERKHLTDSDIQKNMESYKSQASKILNIEKTRFEYNSSWLGELGMQGLFELASKATIAQIMERKEFRERVRAGIDVPYLEMLYPLMQGYDSVALKADVELGGTDQKFNLLMGRQIQKRYGQKEQDVVMMNLLTGTDGNKMSKSANNFVALTADPNDMYAKIMSVPDDLMYEYAELCTDLPLDEFKNPDDPFNLKKKLAKTIVEIYHGRSEAINAQNNFTSVFQKGNYQKTESQEMITTINPGSYKPVQFPILSGVTTSTVQAKDIVRNGGTEVDGRKIIDWSTPIDLKSGMIIKVGKKKIIKVSK